MADVNDIALLRQFVGENSELAFSELVRRHINLVYSVALRFTNNTGDAEDVAQAVFIILAQKAARLSNRVVLAGWLYETTRTSYFHGNCIGVCNALERYRSRQRPPPGSPD